MRWTPALFWPIKFRQNWWVLKKDTTICWATGNIVTFFSYYRHKLLFSCCSCSQCFEPFPDGIYFEFDGRKYCEHDFHVLYAPCCNKCSMFFFAVLFDSENWYKCWVSFSYSKIFRRFFYCFSLRLIFDKRCHLNDIVKSFTHKFRVENTYKQWENWCFYFFFLDEFIVGRVIKAMNANWHPQCFRCELCSKELADIGFLRNCGRYVLLLETWRQKK